MPESHECPNCGGSLPFVGGSGLVRCRYCGSYIRTDNLECTDGHVVLPPDAEEEIEDLLRKGDRIAAIKVHRSHIPGTLKESRDAVDSMARKMGLLPVRSGCCSITAAAFIVTAVTALAVLLA